MTNDALAKNSPMGGVRADKDAYGVRYLGGSADLVQAGIVRPEQLPGESGPRKRSAVYYNGQPASRGRTYPRDERYMEIKLVGRDRFSVWVPSSRAQRELHAEAEGRSRQIGIERERAKSDLSYLPCSREAYRASSLSTFESLLGFALFCAEGTDKHGYSFDFNTLQEVKAAAARLRAALQGGAVVFDASRHARVVTELRERAGLPPGRPLLSLVAGTEVMEHAG